MLFWVAQATSWNILSGYSGYFSFGQAAYVGVGAYTTAVLSGRHGVELLRSPSRSAARARRRARRCSSGAVAFRLRSLRGEIFALLTLAVPFILAALARINPAIDGGQGITVPVPAFPELARRLPGLALPAQPGDRRDRGGRRVRACSAPASAGRWPPIRDAEDVAEGLGVPTFRYKMVAIAITAVHRRHGRQRLRAADRLRHGGERLQPDRPAVRHRDERARRTAHWLGPVVGARWSS